jgi:hypothetical protein
LGRGGRRFESFHPDQILSDEMARVNNCVYCGDPVDRMEFPRRGSICFNCEVWYNVNLNRKGLLVNKVVKKRDVYRAALGSGHFPLTFNFPFKRDGRYIQCSFCGIFVYYRYITRDHVYPKSKGGVIKAPACESCNVAKENMLPIEWALYASNHGLDIATIPIGAEYMQSEVEWLPTKHELLAQFSSSLVSYIGIMSAFQAEQAGSIPVTSTKR